MKKLFRKCCRRWLLPTYYCRCGVLIIAVCFLAGCVTTPTPTAHLWQSNCPSQDVVIVYGDEFVIIPEGALNEDKTENYWTLPEFERDVQPLLQPPGIKL